MGFQVFQLLTPCVWSLVPPSVLQLFTLEGQIADQQNCKPVVSLRRWLFAATSLPQRPWPIHIHRPTSFRDATSRVGWVSGGEPRCQDCQPACLPSLFDGQPAARQKACELPQQMTRHRAEYPPEHALTTIFSAGTCQSQQAFGHERSRPCHQEKAYPDLPGQYEPYLAVKLFGLMPLHLRSCIKSTTRSATAPPFLACQLRPPPAS